MNSAPNSSALPEERLGQLRVAKLVALTGVDRGAARDAGPLGTGAGLVDPDGRAWVLIEAATRRSLGGALTWAVRREASSLVLIVEAAADVAGHLAREATQFALPIEVRRIDGTAVVPVAPAPAPTPPVPLLATPEIAALLAAADVDVVVEHGVTKAEVLGLELGRVVDVDGEIRFEVGVGRFDREISAMMFSNVPTADALAKAVEMVRQYRRPGATVHPLRDLVPERWLRRLVLADPSVVGAAELTAIDTTIEPASLRESQPSAAAGLTADGRRIVVVCTAGVDLDVVPLAADTRAAIAPDAELVICGPSRILVSVTRAVAAQLTVPARFVDLDLPY